MSEQPERVRRKVNCLTIEFKRKVLKEMEENPQKKKCIVAREFGIPVTTLLSIEKNKAKYTGPGGYSGTNKRIKPPGFVEVERLLLQWMRNSPVRVSYRLLREKAHDFAVALGINAEGINNFKASNGWIANFKKRHGIVFSGEPNNEARFSEAGPSKRSGGTPTGRTKKLKTNTESQRFHTEGCSQDPFDMIEIEEPMIKEEIDEAEFKHCGENSDNYGSNEDESHVETIFCTPGIVKEEHLDPEDNETSEISPLPSDLVQTVIKSEPINIEEAGEMEGEELQPKGVPPLMWRCPLVSCMETFKTKRQMYQHLNLNHAVKGVGPASKSKKALPTVQAVAKPSPAALPAASTLVTTSASSVPSHACGPVTTTTTFSYSSLISTPTVSTSCLPSVTCAVTSAATPPATDPASSPASSATDVLLPTTHVQASTTNVPVPTTNVPAPTTNFHVPSMNFPVPTTNFPVLNENNSTATHPPDSIAIIDSQGKKIIVAQINRPDLSSTGSNKSIHLVHQQLPQLQEQPQQPQHQPQQPQHQSQQPKHQSQQPQHQSQQPQRQSQQLQILSVQKPVKKPKALKIFKPTQKVTQELPSCATDDSDMFSVSLAQFPQNRRVPIKQKMIDVLDCIKQKDISPDNVFIGFFENDTVSRTM